MDNVQTSSEHKDISNLTEFDWVMMPDAEFNAVAAQITTTLEELTAARDDHEKFIAVLLRLPRFLVRDALKMFDMAASAENVTVITITPLN